MKENFLIPFKGKRGKPKFFGDYWEVQFLYPPVVTVVFSFTNIYGRDYSMCKVSVWDFYGKSKFQRRLLGEFVLDSKFKKLETLEDGKEAFSICKKNHYEEIKKKIKDIIENAPGYVKWKWDKKEKVWYRLHIVNGKVKKRELVDSGQPTRYTKSLEEVEY